MKYHAKDQNVFQATFIYIIEFLRDLSSFIVSTEYRIRHYGEYNRRNEPK